MIEKLSIFRQHKMLSVSQKFYTSSSLLAFVLIELFAATASHHVETRDSAASDQVAVIGNVSHFLTHSVHLINNKSDRGVTKNNSNSASLNEQSLSKERELFHSYKILSNITFEEGLARNETKTNASNLKPEDCYKGETKDASSTKKLPGSLIDQLHSSNKADRIKDSAIFSKPNELYVSNDTEKQHDSNEEQIDKAVRSNCTINDKCSEREVVCNFNLHFTLSLKNGNDFRSRVIRCLDQFMRRMEPFHLVGLTFRIDDIPERKTIVKQKFFSDHYRLIYSALIISIVILFSLLVSGLGCTKKREECQTPDSVSTVCTLVNIPPLPELCKEHDEKESQRSLSYLVSDDDVAVSSKKYTFSEMASNFFNSVALGFASTIPKSETKSYGGK